MFSRHSEYRIAEQRIDRLDRATSDDSNGIANQPSQCAQYFRQSRRHHHGIRPRRDVQQGSIQVEQQRRPLQRRQEHIHRLRFAAYDAHVVDRVLQHR